VFYGIITVANILKWETDKLPSS